MIQGSKNLEFQIDIMIRFSNNLSTSCVDTMVIILTNVYYHHNINPLRQQEALAIKAYEYTL